MPTLGFPPRIPLAHTPTPLHLLPRVSEALGVRVWVKRDDLTGSALTGNKVRKLEFCLAQARAQGCDALVTCGGLQSNHCRATALAGARLGLRVRLVLRGEEGAGTADGNLFLDYLAGAEVTTFPLAEYRSNLQGLLQDAARSLEAEGLSPFVIPTGASDGIGIWGYLGAVDELANDFAAAGIEPSHIVSATGSGGTQAGLSLGAWLKGWQAKVVGFAVCDNEAYFQNKVRADMREWQQRFGGICEGVAEVDVEAVPVSVDDRFIGPGYARADAGVFDLIRWLAANEGIVLDPVYTGKAFYGLWQTLERGEWPDARDVVFVHTGGIFGTFAQREQFAF
ncbi:1-aminocyclopropane-1-carboxylate deaminase/D-cysteine desulfhydrase [Pseudomaricurvus sp. HS19]|uniref:1-aminocyclopropane-1-carboxylate deaminase/D-cysteine desulfhydrase n=1 Tax=Pseudomaricurvus sp. HS19 TaxID=2692626 RepID=UPI00136F6514|nr:D-cysteine desulfhydrase family protein [Pseudomaricurvus sp. HS19]MYM62192.1 pyridoxal-phosphate dependent enzyme [Pseudomaricurvus sp. HS19]